MIEEEAKFEVGDGEGKPAIHRTLETVGEGEVGDVRGVDGGEVSQLAHSTDTAWCVVTEGLVGDLEGVLACYLNISKREEGGKGGREVRYKRLQFCKDGGARRGKCQCRLDINET